MTDTKRVGSTTAASGAAHTHTAVVADTLSRCSAARTAQVEGHLEDDDDYEAMCDITATVRASRHPAATELATQLTTLPAATTAALVATADTAATTQVRHVRRVAVTAHHPPRHMLLCTLATPRVCCMPQP